MQPRSQLERVKQTMLEKVRQYSQAALLFCIAIALFLVLHMFFGSGTGFLVVVLMCSLPIIGRIADKAK